MNQNELNGKLLDAAGQGHTETVKALIAAGADVHAYDNEALRDAARCGYTETVKELLAAGADVENAIISAIEILWYSTAGLDNWVFNILKAREL